MIIFILITKPLHAIEALIRGSPVGKMERVINSYGVCVYVDQRRLSVEEGEKE